MIRLYTDAATKGNFGPGGLGIMISATGVHDQTHQALPPMTNHEAEFEAAIAGLLRVQALGLTGSVALYTDSKLVISALDKRYAKHYADYVTKLLAVADQFSSLFWQWVPDHQNHGAHDLALQGLHEDK
ncbi:ribonuclease HI family protein [Lacticaseibacillus nasuensis]|uniref:ribonuclease HI family protein n=1 Tax=Lacticaseibacillus nasuensis TaxID=944671 RepID=UPI0022474EC7|nr:ribonuclease HI family protein [Lacticaseibacillus nasuensis]MCX2454901.1 ribonuclease HI family protein [Lacticaseibacillus nasuensis]